MNGFFWAILALAIFTWLMRAVPFIILHLTGKQINFAQGRLAVMGPAILLSTTLVVIFDDVSHAPDNANAIAYLLTVALVIACAKWSKNIGLSVLIGLVFYGILQFFLN
ncbi:AzlD domain-containing protein [Brackiella oedipodis]|uniref:AzlD domain-containing protein n=1 Tax=Brackiella oedipodis TaxID=124225 RepID=UPI00048F3588|nr:AzlD domain-containing protein [Brackiella oedipodis]